MSGPDIHDETTTDHERVEREPLAQDRDARRPSTAGLDDETAQEVVRDLLDGGSVTRSVSTVRRRQLRTLQSGIATRVMGADSSSTRSQHSPVPRGTRPSRGATPVLWALQS